MKNRIYMIAMSFLLLPIFFIVISSDNSYERDIFITSHKPSTEVPPCIAMHNCIEKYSSIYNIPKKYAYGVAWKETSYSGAFHWEYNPGQISYAGAMGPMQIMYPTAQMMWKDVEFTREKLKNDIEFNVETSMKLLRHLHDRYGDWKIVFGCYNTGRPIVNQYSIDVYNFKGIRKI